MSATQARYFNIPDDILDGIHPEEDTDNSEGSGSDMLEVETIGCKAVFCCPECCPYKAEATGNKNCEAREMVFPEQLKRLKKEKKNWKNICENNKVFNFLLSYANYHISSMFIILLFIATIILPAYSNIVITVIIIIIIAALDNHYNIGIRTTLY